MNKDLKKIFITLGLYSLSCGIFYNFQQLWMAENNLSLKTISTVYSLCAIITVSMIFLCSNLVKQKRLKNFTTVSLIIKAFIMFLLFLLNGSGLNIIIKFLIMIEYAIDVEIYTSIYPLMTLITKDDKIYAKRGIINSFLYYIGALVAGLILGFTIGNVLINYNLYCLVGSIIIFISSLVLYSIDTNKYIKNDNNSNGILFEVINKVKKDKVSHRYLIHIFSGSASYYALTTLMLTIFTINYQMSVKMASILVLILGIVSPILGMIVLSKLTFKNNYINLAIKYFVRLILYLLAIVTGFKIVFLISLIYSRITADSYSHITDGPFVNRYDKDEQFAFCNLREMISYAGRAVGTFFCGLVISINIRYIFLISFVFGIIQIISLISAMKYKDLK